MPQKLQNVKKTDCLIDENHMDFEKGREILRSYPVPLAECARMMCSFLFAAFVFYLQPLLFAAYVFYLQHTFLFAALVFYLQRTFLFAVFAFCLQRFLFLLAAFLFCLQCFFFVCSVSLVGHRKNQTMLRCSS